MMSGLGERQGVGLPDIREESRGVCELIAIIYLLINFNIETS